MNTVVTLILGDKMNKWVLLGISMAMCLCGTIARKRYSNIYKANNFYQSLFICITSAISAVVIIAVGGIPIVSGFTAILGLAFGLTTALQMVFTLKAIENGPLAYTSVIASLSTVIPTFSGIIFWGESISTVQIIGVVLMLVCICLSTGKSDPSAKINWKWVIYCALVFVTTGLIGVMQKWHQNTAYKDELSGFLTVAFAVSFVYGIIVTLKYRKETAPLHITNSFVKKYCIPAVIMVICGVAVALNNILNLRLSGEIDSAVFFPVVNGGGLVLTTVAAFVIFRERLILKQWIGLIIGLISVILLCNPF